MTTVLWLGAVKGHIFISRTMCETDNPFKVRLCVPICICIFLFICEETKHPHSMQSTGWEAVSHGGFCWDFSFMWKQSLGPFSLCVVTEDNEIHNICHSLGPVWCNRSPFFNPRTSNVWAAPRLEWRRWIPRPLRVCSRPPGSGFASGPFSPQARE